LFPTSSVTDGESIEIPGPDHVVFTCIPKDDEGSETFQLSPESVEFRLPPRNPSPVPPPLLRCHPPPSFTTQYVVFASRAIPFAVYVFPLE
jgi:hypothetical protein